MNSTVASLFFTWEESNTGWVDPCIWLLFKSYLHLHYPSWWYETWMKPKHYMIWLRKSDLSKANWQPYHRGAYHYSADWLRTEILHETRTGTVHVASPAGRQVRWRRRHKVVTNPVRALHRTWSPPSKPPPCFSDIILLQKRKDKWNTKQKAIHTSTVQCVCENDNFSIRLSARWAWASSLFMDKGSKIQIPYENIHSA